MLARWPVAFGVLALCSFSFAQNPVDYADPMNGTGGHGHTFPGATMPFGMVKLSPDTRLDTWDGSSGYHFSDSTILGFSHTHLSGTGVGALGDIAVMPFVGVPKLDQHAEGAFQTEFASKFSHSQESAKPGSYRVFLQTPGVEAELTATERAGFQRYTFPAAGKAGIVIDLDHGISNRVVDTYVKPVGPRRYVGYRTCNDWGGRRTCYFAIELSKPVSGAFLEGFDLHPPLDMKESGHRIGHLGLVFSTKKGEQVLVKVGISATGIAGAQKNLAAEIPGWDFDATRMKAAEAWKSALGAIQASSHDPKRLRIFYSNLYQSMLAPSLFDDIDRIYMGRDHKVHPDPGFDTYTAYSLWDTFRAEHPLLTLIQPRLVPDMTACLVQQFKDAGGRSMPVWPLWDNETWCMVGDHSAPVIVDAFLKGELKIDAEATYRALKSAATARRGDGAQYETLGYVASDGHNQATAKTIEYGVDDYAVAVMAQSLGHKAEAEAFFRASSNYRNLYDSRTGFFRGRTADGRFRKRFDPLGEVNTEYTEADAWPYLFAAQQDPESLIQLMGGDQLFCARLDQMFDTTSEVHSDLPDISGLIGQYPQGDEQVHHAAYLFDFAGKPWRTQARIRQVMREMYTEGPEGQCGNNDCGQMSAWYVMSAAGLYEVNPVSGIYEIGSPDVDKAVLHLGKADFSIEAVGNSGQNVYIQSATLNGKPFDRCWLSHAELEAGGDLKLVMGPQPNMSWASSSASRPPKSMPPGFKYPDPPAASPLQPAGPLALPVRIACGAEDDEEGFVADPLIQEGAINMADRHPVSRPAGDTALAMVYLGEHYGTDFTYRLSVPNGKSYLLRLHFAEVFGDKEGERLEDVLVNGKPVLSRLDIVSEAGGPFRGLVKEFPNLKPGPNGVISVRFRASKGSPDQNAKISAIELLEEGHP